MMVSSLRSTTVRSTSDNPVVIDLPKGYNLITETESRFFAKVKTELYFGEEGKQITLNPGSYCISVLKDEQEFEYNQTIAITNNGFLNSSYHVLLTVRATTTEMTYRSAKIFRLYSAADPGFITELQDALQSRVNRICESQPQINDQNKVTIKKLIEESIMRVIRDYALKNQEILFTEFTKIADKKPENVQKSE